ncbi:MAG: AbrB/MazE/SpoVT family DNA-binding domain-containing protein [Gammaproteobacteria bacterium]|nr:AbrB/MazE/SpoVT family DNA-binding domain-containing protein [Gammaproteobacteria bacterium]
MQTEIKRWGNSAAVRLPSKLLAALRLEINSAISIDVKDNKIIIEAVSEQAKDLLRFPFSEATLLNGMTPESAHADDLAEVTALEFEA